MGRQVIIRVQGLRVWPALRREKEQTVNRMRTSCALSATAIASAITASSVAHAMTHAIAERSESREMS